MEQYAIRKIVIIETNQVLWIMINHEGTVIFGACELALGEAIYIARNELGMMNALELLHGKRLPTLCDSIYNVRLVH